MKKYLYVLLCLLLIPLYVYATDGVSGVEHPAKVNSVATPDKVCGVSGLAAGAACSPPSCPATCEMTATEGFEGSSNACGTGDSQCINTWAGTGSPTIATPPGTPAANTACTASLRCNSTSSTLVYDVWDHGSTIANTVNLNFVFYIYVDSKTITDGNRVRIAAFDDAASPSDPDWFLAITYWSPHIYLQVVSSGSTVEMQISLDTWYKVAIHIDDTAANCTISINDGSTHEVDYDTFTRNDYSGCRYLIIGPQNYTGGASEALDLHFGYAYVSAP